MFSYDCLQRTWSAVPYTTVQIPHTNTPLAKPTQVDTGTTVAEAKDTHDLKDAELARTGSATGSTTQPTAWNGVKGHKYKKKPKKPKNKQGKKPPATALDGAGGPKARMGAAMCCGTAAGTVSCTLHRGIVYLAASLAASLC